MDHRDRLILALSALLRAERETRDAFEAALEAGAFSTDMLRSLASDPIPFITQDDLDHAEDFAKPYLPRNRLEIS